MKRLLFLLGSVLGITASATLCSAETESLDIVFTHDLHSYLDSVDIEKNGEVHNIGGFARLKTVLNEKRAKNPDTLVLDAGDFSMGTLYHTVFDTDAIEYRMLGELGYDATTFGNHEFDFGTEAIASMMESAASKGNNLPPLVVCNADLDADSDAAKRISKAGETCGLTDYIILEKGGIKVAVTGVFGKEAFTYAPTCELTFSDPIESVKNTVKEIKETENPDAIICISHSGTSDNPEKSEDELLAKAVPELDLIVSGHSHTSLEKPIIYGNTAVVSSGEYGKNAGTLSMERTDKGRWKIAEYELVPLDESIKPDEETQKLLDSFRTDIDAHYFDQFGYSADQVLAENDIVFETVDDLYNVHTEHALGDIMSDAYRYTVNNLGTDEPPVDVAVVPSGTVRGTYVQGDITVADVFESFSLGNGSDGIAGYPLISVYLTGEELKIAAEIDASVSDFMDVARLYNSGLSFNYNPHRMILNKVTQISLQPEIREDNTFVTINDAQLYRVVTDLYTGRMLSAVTDQSFGILKIIPKNADGTPVENFENAAVLDKDGKEVKAWAAIANYMESFEDTDGNGIGNIPDYYETIRHNRKNVEESRSPVSLLKNPNKYSMIIYLVILALILILVLIITLIVKLIKKLRRCHNKKTTEHKK